MSTFTCTFLNQTIPEIQKFLLEHIYLSKRGTIVLESSDGTKFYDYSFQSPSGNPIFDSDGQYFSMFPGDDIPDSALWSVSSGSKILEEVLTHE